MIPEILKSMIDQKGQQCQQDKIEGPRQQSPEKPPLPRSLPGKKTGQKGCGSVTFTVKARKAKGPFFGSGDGMARAMALAQDIGSRKLEGRELETVACFREALAGSTLSPMMEKILQAMQGNTLTVTLISGKSVNEVCVTCDVRLLPGFGREYLTGILEDLARKWDCTYEITSLGQGYESSPQGDFLKILEQATLEQRGKTRQEAQVVPFVSMGSSDGHLLVDCGANVDARPSHLVQFAKMGSIYMEHVMGVKNPKVAIVNIGAEEEKGNALVKDTFPLLKECKDLNFIGSIEAREIPHGQADVIVCEAFAGNVILKLYEGLAAVLVSKIKEGMLSTLRSKIGALLVKPALKQTLKSFDVAEYGGAPLLGLNGLVVKTHGSSKSKEIRNSIIQCVTFKEQGINDKIRENILREEG